ncbi:MAG: hypothetical protein IKP88_20895 [Lachnospiraceae bacterium]|nr:hypothetical protein [Lachnospiraceae bacterium]
MKTQKTVAAAAMLISFSAALSGCSKVNSIISNIDEKNYTEALDVFSNSNLNEDDAKTLAEQMKQRIEDSLSKYAKDEISKSDVTEIITTAYNMNVGDLLSYVGIANNKLNTLTMSKQAYDTGVQDSVLGKWSSAYKAFSKVVEEDINHDKALAEMSKCITGYRDEVEKKVNEYSIKEDYNGAVSYLNNLKKESPFCEEIRVFVNDKFTEVIIPYIKKLYQGEISNFNFNVFGDVDSLAERYGVTDNSEIISFKNELTDKYLAEVRSQLEKNKAENNYSEALRYAESIASYRNLPPSIKDYCTSSIESLKTETVLYQAKEAAAQNDIASALKIISDYKAENSITVNAELDGYVDTISKEYINTILTKVAKLREEENYAAALTMLNKANEIIKNDEITKQIEEINAIKPTYLSDLKISKSFRFDLKDSGDPIEDTVGNKYEVGNLFIISSATKDWSNPEIGSVDFNLGYQYTTLSGTIAVDDISNDSTGILKFKGDDVVLYSLDVSRIMTPVTVDIDVSTVDWLNITIEDPKNGEIDVILSNFRFSNEPVKKAPDTVDENTDGTTEDGEPETQDTETENTDTAGSENQ